MSSYTLGNWDGGLSNSQETSSPRQEKQPSSSSTVHSRATPTTALKAEKSLANGNFTPNKHGYQAGGESSGLTEPLNGIQNSQEMGYMNFLSTNGNGSPAFAVQTTPLPNLATSDLTQTKFFPILESPLHKTRRDASILNPLPFYLPPTSHNPPHPPQKITDDIDTISIHTMDAEGEDEFGDLIIVEDILTSSSSTRPLYSPPRSRAPSATRATRNTSLSASLQSPLFTPPPSEYIPVDRLFTPDPVIRKTRSLKMPHVQVPPLRRPKSDYIVFSNITRKKVRRLPSQARVQVHNSLGDAMQAAYSHNEDLGILPPQVSQKGKPKARKQGGLNGSAGPSTTQLPPVVNISRKRGRPRKNDGDDKDGGKAKKRSRTLIDLTLSGDERANRISKTPSSARTRYEVQKDSLRLYLGVIPPAPIPVVAYNTRFLRKFQAKHGVLALDHATANGKASYRYFIYPKPSIQVDEGAIMSVGDSVVWEEDFHSPVDDDLDDEVVFVGDLRRDVRRDATFSQRRSSLHIPQPPPQPSPPKIDLAAMRKQQNRKAQKNHVSSTNLTPTHRNHSYAAKSSSSSTGLYPETHKHSIVPLNESQPQLENVISSTLSAKALGKRKATNPDSSEDLIPPKYAPIHLTGRPPILVNEAQGPAGNLDLFFHTYTRSPSPGIAPSSSTHVSYSNFQSISPFYSSSVTTENRNPPFVDNPAPHLYKSETPVEDAEHRQERLFSESILDGLETQSMPSELWSAIEDETSQQYEFSTIDPTLLGGHPMSQDLLEPEPEPELDPISIAILHSPSPLNSEPSSSTSHHSSENEYEPSVVAMDATNRSASRVSSASSALAPRGVRRRRQSQRKMVDMVPIDDLDISDNSSNSSGYESSSSSSDARSKSPALAVSRRPRVAAASRTKPELQKASHLPSPLNYSQVQQGWPLEKVESYCHQCRNKSRILKMTCSCGKLFCSRCVTVRYPGKFDYAQKQNQSCPCCQGFCNCTVCCTKRGETYVSSARGPRPKLTKTRPPSIRERVSLGGKTNLPPLTQIPLEPVKYWGAVYSLTGKKIASTFVPQTEEGHPAVVFGLHDSEEGAVVTQKKPRPDRREFVGRVQRHWGYSKNKMIKELNDRSFSKKLPASKKKLYNGDTRWYVGHGARLFWPRKEMDSSLLDDLSPLSSLEDEDEEPDEPGSPQPQVLRSASLGEEVVGQVIAMAFDACGTASEVYPPLA